MNLRLILSLAFAGLLISFLLVNCQKNDRLSSSQFSKAKQTDLTNVSKPMDMSLARLYYKLLVKETGDKVNFGQALGDQRPNRKYAYWKKAYVSQTDRYTFVELPLLYNRRATIVKRPADAVENKAEISKIAKASFDRLLIYKNKKNATINQRIITYTPDLDYLERHHNDISQNQINKIDKDYSGTISFKKWDGTVLFTFKYKDGKLLGRVVPKARAARQTQPAGARATETCETVIIEDVIETCYYADPEGLTEWCEYEVVGVTYVEECTEDPGDPGDYDDGCNCNHPTDPPTSIQNNTSDPCVGGAVQMLTGEQLPNLISALASTTYTGIYSPFNLVIAENSTDYPHEIAWSNSTGNTDYIYFNPAFFDTHTYNNQVVPATEEYWAMTFAHELVHRFMDHSGVEADQVLQHQTMLTSWVGAMSNFLQQGYNLSLEDARALAIRGMGDALVDRNHAPIPNWENFLQTNFGFGVADVFAITDGYVTGAKGTICP